MSFVYVVWLTKQFSGWDGSGNFSISNQSGKICGQLSQHQYCSQKILPNLHSNLWRDLSSSALWDFNLKFVNTCNLLSRAYNVGRKARLNHLRRSENIQHHIEGMTGVYCRITFSCTKCSCSCIRCSSDRAVLGLRCLWLNSWFTNVTSYRCTIWSKPTNKQKKKNPTIQSIFSYFSDILVLL